MVTHIVLWNVKDKAKIAQTYQTLKQKLESLVGVVPGLCSANVGKGFNGFDLALVSQHDSKQAVADYQEHPAHLAVKEYVQSVVCERVCCDFEVE